MDVCVCILYCYVHYYYYKCTFAHPCQFDFRMWSECASVNVIEWKMFAYDRILSFMNIYIKLSSLWWFIHVSLIHAANAQCSQPNRTQSTVWNSPFFSAFLLFNSILWKDLKWNFSCTVFILWFTIAIWQWLNGGFLNFSVDFFALIFRELVPIFTYSPNIFLWKRIRKRLIEKERETLTDWVRRREIKREKFYTGWNLTSLFSLLLIHTVC